MFKETTSPNQLVFHGRYNTRMGYKSITLLHNIVK